jgi:hypothetical protein
VSLAIDRSRTMWLPSHRRSTCALDESRVADHSDDTQVLETVVQSVFAQAYTKCITESPRRKGKVHTKVLANMARLVQVMGRGTHFMMEQRHASQTQLEKEAAAKAKKTQLAAAAAGAAWLSDEDDEPDDEW